MDLLIALLCSLGYDPDGPENVERFVPASVDDVRELQRHLKDEPVDEDDVCCLLMSLLCKWDFLSVAVLAHALGFAG